MERKHRIGIEAQRIFRTKKHGMDMVALELIKALQHIDTENEYFIFTASGPDTACMQETANFKIVTLTAPTYPVWEQIALASAVRRYGCDILHCTSNTAPVITNIPLITTVHDIIYLENWHALFKSKSWYQKMGQIYRRLVVPQVLHQSKQVLTVSEYEKGQIVHRFPQYKHKTSVLYNACGNHFTDEKSPNEQEIINRLQLPDNYIFYIGNTDPKKNTATTVKAYAEYFSQTDEPLPLVMPDFDRNLFASFLPADKVEDVMNRTVFTGYIANKELPVVYRNAGLFLYPSLRESFGIPILEAMACGTPVITSDTSAMPEIGGNAAFYTDPLDYKAIATAISIVLNDSTKQDKYKQRGKARAKQFSWKQSAQKLLENYTHLLDSNQTHAAITPSTQQ